MGADARARSCCPAGSLPVPLWPAALRGGGSCGYAIHWWGEQGAGRSPGTCRGRRRWQRPAHARLLPEAWNARGACPYSRAHACASRGFPACACCQSQPGACACYLRRTGVARFPLLQAPAPRHPLPAPGRPVPLLSSRNGAGAARGRAPGTRLALGLALSATAWLAPPRTLPQSVAPKAPLSSGGGGSCFRFFLSLQSGVASSTQLPLPLPQRRAAAAEGCGGGGDWRTAETASAPASGCCFCSENTHDPDSISSQDKGLCCLYWLTEQIQLTILVTQIQSIKSSIGNIM